MYTFTYNYTHIYIYNLDRNYCIFKGEMLSQEWILVIFLITGSVTAMVPVPVHHMADELLRNGPDTVIRKQRSLDTNPQYYNDLRSFKYHGGEGERKLDREYQGEREIGEEDEEIEFLPSGT